MTERTKNILACVAIVIALSWIAFVTCRTVSPPEQAAPESFTGLGGGPLAPGGAGFFGAATSSPLTGNGLSGTPITMSSSPTLSGTTTVAGLIDTGAEQVQGVVTATATSGTVVDWDPSGVGSLAGIALVRESPSAALTLSGMLAGANGQIIEVLNVSTSFTITLNNEDAGDTTATNRFTLPNAGAYVIQPGGGLLMRYSNTTNRWTSWSSALTQVGTGMAILGSTANLNLSGASCGAGSAVNTISSVGAGGCTAVVTSVTGSGFSTSSGAVTYKSTSTMMIYGPGTDGAQTFDGTTTILGMVPSSSTYTLTRPIWCNGCTVNTGVTIKLNGFPFFDAGTLTLSGTANINDNGANAVTTTNGAARSANWYGADAAGGASGTNAGGASGVVLCSPWLSSTVGGTAGAIGANGGSGTAGQCIGGGGGGASATSAGGAGGASTVAGTAGCGDLEMLLRHGKTQSTLATTLTYGTGGGGGGTNGGGGGGGGASGGIAFVAAKRLAGSGTITANGGNGGNAGGAGGGGGGGGGGGYAIMVYETNSGTVSLASNGGTGGTGNGGGNGGNGGSCLTFAFNLSGDGT